MKKLIVLLLVLVPIVTFSQGPYSYNYTVTIPVATDTNYILSVDPQAAQNFMFSYKRLDASDATIDIGTRNHPDSLVFNRLDNSSLPFTLADSTVGFRVYQIGVPYLVFKITSGSVTGGLTMDLTATSPVPIKELPGSILMFMGKE